MRFATTWPAGSAAAMALLVLGGCAGGDRSAPQDIAVTTAPPGADCRLEQQGVPVARFRTPGAATADTAKGELTLVCAKPGYYQAIYRNVLPAQGGFADAMSDTFASWGMGSGAEAQFSSPVTIVLRPMPRPAAPPAPPPKPAKPAYGALQPAPPPVPTPRVDQTPLAPPR